MPVCGDDVLLGGVCRREATTLTSTTPAAFPAADTSCSVMALLPLVRMIHSERSGIRLVCRAEDGVAVLPGLAVGERALGLLDMATDRLVRYPEHGDFLPAVPGG